MLRTGILGSRFGLIGLALILGLLVSGCAWDRFERPQPDTTNVAQRPTYEVEGTKPLYLGGYAGAYYGPSLLRGR